MPKLEITNMVMVQNPQTGQVVVQQRVKSWAGISFPGGHAGRRSVGHSGRAHRFRQRRCCRGKPCDCWAQRRWSLRQRG